MANIPTQRAEALTAWDSPVSVVRFVDDARTVALERLGIRTVEDLLRHYPFRFLDLTSTPTLAEVQVGSDATVVGRVHEVRVKKPRSRLTITEVGIVDGTGVLLGVWFNQPYAARRFAPGDRVAFAGRVQLEFGLKQIRTPFAEKLGEEDDPTLTARVLPVHRATEGISTNWMRRLVAEALGQYSDVPDFLPARLRIERDLWPLTSALRCIHFPEESADAGHARRRLAYDELFVLQVGLAIRRHGLVDERKGVPHVLDGPALTALRDDPPFSLTGDQTRAVSEILADMASQRPMNRMLLGDVGTGKTIVAAHALAAAADTLAQAAMMAPTEVLAEQYALRLGPLLDTLGIPWTLLTGSTSSAQRSETLRRVAEGSVAVLFGTHALLEETVQFAALSLAVVDEQHRFGVVQRLGLRGKGEAVDMLVMTATPIPRTLALTLYGDLDVSYLRERPSGRSAESNVTTTVMGPQLRPSAYERVRLAVRAGRQAYVICALVEESTAAEAKAAVREAERLRADVFDDLRVGLLTGKMKPADKTATMHAFRAGAIDVLVATTVVEVGVDVPNATVMVVEDAERFGLAQLHQLRGRIGRGEHPGEFILFANPSTDEGRARMDAIATTADGFELAERDLVLRGEGQVLGERQHGLPELRLASLIRDADLLDQARADAVALVSTDPHLRTAEHLPLARELRRRFNRQWEWVSSG